MSGNPSVPPVRWLTDNTRTDRLISSSRMTAAAVVLPHPGTPVRARYGSPRMTASTSVAIVVPDVIRTKRSGSAAGLAAGRSLAIRVTSDPIADRKHSWLRLAEILSGWMTKETGYMASKRPDYWTFGLDWGVSAILLASSRQLGLVSCQSRNYCDLHSYTAGPVQPGIARDHLAGLIPAVAPVCVRRRNICDGLPRRLIYANQPNADDPLPPGPGTKAIDCGAATHTRFELADTAMLMRHFADAEQECAALLGEKLALPAHDQCTKASHLFNLLDARGVISVTQRGPTSPGCTRWRRGAARPGWRGKARHRF